MNSAGHIPANSRERIVDAAIRAFKGSGFTATPTREIAEAAGVKEPLLFYHFHNKAGLYLAAFERQLEQLILELDTTLADQPDAYARLETFASVYLRHHLNSESGLGTIATEFGALPPDVRTSIIALNDTHVKARLMAILAGGVAGGAFRPVNVALCAHAILGLLITFIRGHESGRDRYDCQTLVEQVLDYYGAGLLPGAVGIRARSPGGTPVAASESGETV